ncbi:MAG: long-chain-fatty-acid--CoA ligase [bacterium JZ-2024 1]
MNRPWLESYDRYVPRSLHIPEANLAIFLESHCLKRYSKQPAFCLQDFYLTYSQVFRYARAFAGFLLSRGLAPAQNVAIVLPNLFHMPVSYLGSLLAGNTAVLLSPLSTSRELEFFFKDSEATCVVTVDLLQDRVIPAAESAGIKNLIVGSAINFLPLKTRVLAWIFKRKNLHSVVGGGIPFCRVLGEPARVLPPSSIPEAPAVLIYTGGTTGIPKAVVLTHRNLLANMLQCDAWFPHIVPQQKTVASVVPLFHSFGLTVCLNFSMYRGLVSHLHPRFSLQAFAEALVRNPPIVLPGSPSLFQALAGVAGKKYDFRGIVFAISGAAPLNPATLLEFEEKTGSIFVEGYGLTETSPVTHITPLFGKRKLRSIGVPVPETDARIVDLDDGLRDVPEGTEGELVIKGPQVMAGYWRKPEETAQALRDGWLYTGDIAKMDSDGFFYIVDRKKDLIIVNGMNVYSAEVEREALKFPGVKDAAVVGIPDEVSGEAVRLFVIPDSDHPPDKTQLRNFLSQSLAPHKVPKIISFVEDFPRNFLGKVLKRELRKQSAT